MYGSLHMQPARMGCGIGSENSSRSNACRLTEKLGQHQEACRRPQHHLQITPQPTFWCLSGGAASLFLVIQTRENPAETTSVFESSLWEEPFLMVASLSEPSPCSWSKEMSLQHLEVRPPERGIEDALTPGDSLNTVLIDGHLAR